MSLVVHQCAMGAATRTSATCGRSAVCSTSCVNARTPSAPTARSFWRSTSSTRRPRGPTTPTRPSCATLSCTTPPTTTTTPPASAGSFLWVHFFFLLSLSPSSLHHSFLSYFLSLFNLLCCCGLFSLPAGCSTKTPRCARPSTTWSCTRSSTPTCSPTIPLPPSPPCPP